MASKLAKVSNTYNKVSDAILKFLHKHGWILIIAVGIILSTIGKAFAFYYRSGDFNSFLIHWMNRYKELGFIKALTNHYTEIVDGVSQSKLISDYTPFYYNILIILSQFVPEAGYVYAIKIVDILFELSLGAGFFFISYHVRKNFNIAAIVGVIALVIPAVIINGAIWGQCDIIYVSFVVWSFYFLLKEKGWVSVLMFSIAFAIKLQAIFFLPFLFLMLLKRKVRLYQFLIIPVVYFIFMLPNLIAGAGFGYLVTIYGNQTGSYTRLTLSAPSIYSYLPGSDTLGELLTIPGIVLCLVSTMCYVFYYFKKDIDFSAKNMITLALFSTLVTTFLLPRMHERYFILADILAVLYVAITKRGYFKALLINVASALCTLSWVVGLNVGPFGIQIATTLNLVAIILMIALDLPKLDLIKKETSQEQC